WLVAVYRMKPVPADPVSNGLKLGEWSNQHDCVLVKLLPGEYHVASGGEGIITVLGSCVSACVRDPNSGYGGMNHFMLPTGEESASVHSDSGLATRFGLIAMENLIDDIAALGCDVRNLEAKVFGGANVLNMPQSEIGRKNIRFVREFLSDRKLNVLAEDLGGEHPRKVIYRPSTGKVMVRKLRALQKNVVSHQESRFRKTLTLKESGQRETVRRFKTQRGEL
ncbi:MAG: hypothetical protein AAF542_16840, partial [Pseudomonadota bacterium]